MPPTFTPTLKQRIAGAKFVAYELRMLRDCADMEIPKTKSPATWVVKSLWYEGLVLHARVLRDFFFTLNRKSDGKRRTEPDDIVAVDYFSASSSWPCTSLALPPYLAQHKDHMNKALAHLSYLRDDYTGKAKEWSAVKLRTEIGEKWFEFLEKLQALNEPAATWFLDAAKEKNVPIVAPF